MRAIYLILTVSITFHSLSAHARSSNKNIFRDCGIGALIFPKTGWAAVTSNIIWDLGTTASTTTTSSPDQCAGRDYSAAEFIYHNYAKIEEETAAGQGENIATVLNILGCKRSRHNNIIKSIRSSFSKSIKSDSYLKKDQLEKAEYYYNDLMQEVQSHHSTQCQTT